jgi:hypothetical protein
MMLVEGAHGCEESPGRGTRLEERSSETNEGGADEREQKPLWSTSTSSVIARSSFSHASGSMAARGLRARSHGENLARPRLRVPVR